MSTVIIGSGMSGLAAATHIKELLPGEHVIVVEQPRQVAQSVIAGQRIRRKEMEELLPFGVPSGTDHITNAFIVAYEQALRYWEAILGSEEREEWFGPQLAGGKGKRALEMMKEKAASLGVQFDTATVSKLVRSPHRIEGIITGSDKHHSLLRADRYILANGGSVGALFQSTNVENDTSAHVLAYEAGIPLIGATQNMIHPFGKCDENGTSRPGCNATDEIADAVIILRNGKRDEATMELLKTHGAHTRFPEISLRFIENGGMVTIQFPDGKIRHAKPALHHSHLGINTSDGVRVEDMENLFAVGDAGSFGPATGFRPRPSGTGQLKCLVDGLIVAQRIQSEDRRKDEFPFVTQERIQLSPEGALCMIPLNVAEKKQLKQINTEGLLGTTYSDDGQHRQLALNQWETGLMTLPQDAILVQLSLGIANAFERKVNGNETEPIPIRSEGSSRTRGERL